LQEQSPVKPQSVPEPKEQEVVEAPPSKSTVSALAGQLWGAGGPLGGGAAKKKAVEEEKKTEEKKTEEAAADAGDDASDDADESKSLTSKKKKKKDDKKKDKKKKDKRSKSTKKADFDDVVAKGDDGETTKKKKKGKRGSTLSRSKSDTSDSEILLSRFDISGSGGQPMRCTADEIVLRAVDTATGDSVVLQLLSDPKRLEAELEARASADEDDADNIKTSHVVEVLEVLSDTDCQISIPPGSPFVVNYLGNLTEDVRTILRTHGDSSQYDAVGDVYSADKAVTDCDDHAGYPCLLVLDDYEQTLESHTDRYPRPNLRLARGVAADVVVGLMLLHTEGKVHRDLSPRRIMRCADGDDDDEDDFVDKEEGGPEGRWKIAGLGSCGKVGEVVEHPGELSGEWGFLPPEAAAAFADGRDVTTDAAWDLWALGCVLYRLVFGSDLWTISRTGRVSDEDLGKLSNWTKVDIWKRAAIAFPPASRTDGERAAIDLVAKLLAPTPEERMRNFEFGIISVHQHEFVEGLALEPDSLAAFRATQELVAIEEADRKRFHVVADPLSLEESWELSRARNVLLLGAFEPVEVHVPTSFVVLKKPLPEGGADCEVALKEGVRWSKAFGDVGPLVRKAILNNDVGAVGRFWAHIHGLFAGRYVYMYLVDDMTGEPVILPPGRDTIGHGIPYPIPIKTRSDVLPKLLPLMHLSMRSTALYHGATGIARLFGGGSKPKLSEKARLAAQPIIDDLKDEEGNTATRPFGSFLDDVAMARENRERFLKQESNVRCRSLKELVKFYERKGVIVPGRPRGEDDFVGLKRLADDEGLALWTLLDDVDGFREATKKRAVERLKEEKNLWSDPFEGRVIELEEALAEKESEQKEALPKSEGESPATAENEKKIHELEEALATSEKKVQEALVTLKDSQKRASEADAKRIATLESTLKQTMAELEESKSELEDSKQKVKNLEKKAGKTLNIPTPKKDNRDPPMRVIQTGSNIVSSYSASSTPSSTRTSSKNMKESAIPKKLLPGTAPGDDSTLGSNDSSARTSKKSKKRFGFKK